MNYMGLNLQFIFLFICESSSLFHGRLIQCGPHLREKMHGSDFVLIFEKGTAAMRYALFNSEFVRALLSVVHQPGEEISEPSSAVIRDYGGQG